MIATETMSSTTKRLTSSGLPSLSENTFLRYISFGILFVAQIIPDGMTFFGIPSWMDMNGKNAMEIGGFAALVMVFIHLLQTTKHFEDIEQLESDHLEKFKTVVLPAPVSISSSILPNQRK